MRSRSVIALLSAAVVAGALLLAPQSASAQSASFTNTDIGGDSGTFHVATLDVDYNAAAVTVTLHFQHWQGPGIQAQLYLLDGAFTKTSGQAYSVYGSSTTGSDGTAGPAYFNTAGFGSTPITTNADGVVVTSDRSAQQMTFTVPSSHILWSGPIFVGATVNDRPDNESSEGFQSATSSGFVGYGPLTSAPTPTTTTANLSSSTQVYGGTPAVVIASVAPASAGTVALVEGNTVVTTANLMDGTAGLVLPSTLPSGSHTFTVRFTPTNPADVLSSASFPVGVTVLSSAASTKTRLKLSKTTQLFGKSGAKVSVTVSGKPAGTVAIYDGKKKLKTLSLKKGTASYTFSKRLKKGTHKIKVTYIPTNKEAFKASTSPTLILKVKK